MCLFKLVFHPQVAYLKTFLSWLDSLPEYYEKIRTLVLKKKDFVVAGIETRTSRIRAKHSASTSHQNNFKWTSIYSMDEEKGSCRQLHSHGSFSQPQSVLSTFRNYRNNLPFLPSWALTFPYTLWCHCCINNWTFLMIIKSLQLILLLPSPRLVLKPSKITYTS